jgi:hypothetical protein
MKGKTRRESAITRRMKRLHLRLAWFTGLLFLTAIGCGKGQVDQALESDARGYFCPKCQAKFYTRSDVFADVCSQCKSPEILDVVGVVCAADQHMTLLPRGRGAIRCERCGKPANAMALPREKDLKNWGAIQKSKAEVSAK